MLVKKYLGIANGCKTEVTSSPGQPATAGPAREGWWGQGWPGDDRFVFFASSYEHKLPAKLVHE